MATCFSILVFPLLLLLPGPPQHCHASGDDFRTDAIARDESDPLGLLCNVYSRRHVPCSHAQDTFPHCGAFRELFFHRFLNIISYKIATNEAVSIDSFTREHPGMRHPPLPDLTDQSHFLMPVLADIMP